MIRLFKHYIPHAVLLFGLPAHKDETGSAAKDPAAPVHCLVGSAPGSGPESPQLIVELRRVAARLGHDVLVGVERGQHDDGGALQGAVLCLDAGEDGRT